MHSSHRSADQLSLSTLAAGLAAAVFLTASVLMTSDSALADQPAAKGPGSSGACRCDDSTSKPQQLWPKQKFAERADAKAALDPNDELATLEALQVTLAEVGDGQTYVWHRAHGRLSGAFQPTTSFKDRTGQVCRHIVMILASGTYSRKTEGIACRLASGRWQLDG